MPVLSIVDASIVVKWFSKKDEEDLNIVLQLLDNAHHGTHILYSSDLLVFELMNALIKGKEFNDQQIRTALDGFFTLPITIIPTNPRLAASAALIAVTYGLTFYDAIYAAIAAEYRAPLITQNIRHQGKVEGVKVMTLRHVE